MTREEAREILAAYREGTEDASDPLMAEALALARKDAALGAWLKESLAFDRQVRGALRQAAAPADLRERILAGAKIIRPTPWWNPRLSHRQMAAAAAVLFVCALGVLWASQRAPSFPEFRQEIMSQSWGPTPHVEMGATTVKDVRAYLAANQLPADFVLPSALAEMQVRGCTVVQWRGHRVPVLCFNSDGKHLHLVVTERALFPDAPSNSPDLEHWDSWRTASWSKDRHSYVLTGLSTPAFVKKFRKDRRWDWGG